MIMTTMISARSLAEEFDRDPKWVREQLRRNYKRPVGRRWQWDEREGVKVREWLKRLLDREIRQ
jgi:hypothetical protein